MAKDKGAKPDTKSKKKTDDDFAKPSDAPATGGDGFKAESEDNVGKLLLITPLRVDEVIGFENKTTEVVVADVVVINEKKPEKSEEHTGVYFFGGWTKGALRGYVAERRVLARLDQDAAKGRGKNAAWVLEDADADDIELAKAYLASVDPFAQKGAEKTASKKAKK